MITTFAVSSLVAFATADKDSIDRQVLSLLNGGNSVGNSPLRTFPGQIRNAVDGLDEYGCWCYFNDNVGRGKGTPVDAIDGFCKTLQDGYQCAIIDSEATDEACVPWEVEYKPGTGDGVNLRNSCNALNDNNCARYGCAVEGEFVNSFLDFVMAGNTIDYNTYAHSNGFDPSPTEGCPIKAAIEGVSLEKSCCGAYPNRFPFKTLGGERACCGSTAYSTLFLDCCSDDQVKATC